MQSAISGRTCRPRACQASETACSDGTDDDCNGLIDCNDSDCSADPTCMTGGRCTGYTTTCGPRRRRTIEFSIARFVEETRVASGGPVAVEWLPNGRTSLVVRISERGTGDAHVVGPRTRAKFKRATGVGRAVVIQFKPGWSRTLFGAPANQLTDQLVTLEDLWASAGRDVTTELLATQCVPELLHSLSRAIAARAPYESTSAPLARRAARMFEARETRVETVAAELGVSTRHLRRAFVETVGIAPKEFARGVRLQRAISVLARSKDWGMIARDAGYYDQAHLIGDFRDLTGLTPTAFVALRAAP